MLCNPGKCNAQQCPQYRAMHTVETVTGYTFEDLRQELARIRGRMPARTLYFWLSRLAIVPNSEGLYEAEDLELLKRLHRFLKRVPNIDKFKQIIRQELNNYAN